MWVAVYDWMLADNEPPLPSVGSMLRAVGVRLTGTLAAAEPGAADAIAEIAATNDPVARINALDEPFRNMWPDGEPGIIYDAQCKMVVTGLRSKYRYTRQKTADGKFKDAPDKNDWSHPVEADQYGTLFILSKAYDPSEFVRSFDFMHQDTNQNSRSPSDSYTGY